MRVKTGPRMFRLLFCILLLSGCSGYGKIAAQRGKTGVVTIDHLISDMGSYDVHFMEAHHRCSPALVFDPKDDNRALRSSQWRQPGSAGELEGILYRIRRAGGGEVFLLLGPDGQRFGFLYAARGNKVYSRAADHRTLELYMKATPCSSGPGPSGP